jgi:ribosome-interacting GTPase 1
VKCLFFCNRFGRDVIAERRSVDLCVILLDGTDFNIASVFLTLRLETQSINLMSKKDQVLTKLFEICQQRNDYVFH